MLSFRNNRRPRFDRWFKILTIIPDVIFFFHLSTIKFGFIMTFEMKVMHCAVHMEPKKNKRAIISSPLVNRSERNHNSFTTSCCIAKWGYLSCYTRQALVDSILHKSTLWRNLWLTLFIFRVNINIPEAENGCRTSVDGKSIQNTTKFDPV